MASALFLLVEFNVTAPAPPQSDTAATSAAQLAERWAALSAYQREIWWQLFATNVLYAIGFLALVPLGLALRALFDPSDARAQLMAAGFALGGSAGTLQTLMNLGTVGHTAAVGASLPADASAAFIGLGMVNEIIGSMTYWLLLLFFLLVRLAMYRVSQLVQERGLLPRALGRLALAVALLYWLALLAQLVGGLAGIREAFLVYRLVILLGGVVLAPLWSFWLGRELHRAARAA